MDWWYLIDMRGSVRQILSPQHRSGIGRSDAWGTPRTHPGQRFGCTGERQDSSGLTYLRARWYNPAAGTFLSRDPFAGWDAQPYSLHPYQYAYSAPVRWADPSGAIVTPPSDSTAFMQGAINAAQSIYQKDGNCFGDNGQSNTDGILDLFFDFICEYGPRDRVFNANAILTQQLSQTKIVERIREQFYAAGPVSHETSSQMSPVDFYHAKFTDAVYTARNFQVTDFLKPAITDFLGGLSAWRVHWDAWGTRLEGLSTVRFELYNETTLPSGTRIGFTRNGTREISFQQYLANPKLHNQGRSSIVNPSLIDTSKYSLVSVLSEKQTRDPNAMRGAGGGTMTQRFIWEEPYDPCYWQHGLAVLRRPTTLYMAEDYGRWP